MGSIGKTGGMGEMGGIHEKDKKKTKNRTELAITIEKNLIGNLPFELEH